jgi:hypothetical protein
MKVNESVFVARTKKRKGRNKRRRRKKGTCSRMKTE